MTELKITKGEWQVFHTDAGLFWVDNESGENICDFYHKIDESRFHAKENAKEHAEFVAEAGTVANETGLTPRQLLERCEEVRESAVKLVAEIDALSAFGPDIREVIGNTNWFILQERKAKLNNVIAKAESGNV